MSAEPWQPNKSFGGLLLLLSSKMKKRGNAVLSQAGLGHLSYNRIMVMAHIAESPCSASEIAKLQSNTIASTSETLQKLEKDGLLSQEVDPSDKRRTLWSLTTKGKKDLKQVSSVIREVGHEMDHFFEAHEISPPTIEYFKKVLSLMCQELFNER